MAADDEVTNFYVALEHMLRTTNASQKQIDAVQAATEGVLEALRTELATLDDQVTKAVKSQVATKMETVEIKLASHLAPVIEKATTAKTAFESSVNALTGTTRRTMWLASALSTAIAVAVVGGVSFYIWLWLPRQESVEEQTMILEHLAAEEHARVVFHDKATVGQCTTSDHRRIPCIRVLANEGSFNDAEGHVYYAIDPER
jgi:hypothetical protein